MCNLGWPRGRPLFFPKAMVLGIALLNLLLLGSVWLSASPGPTAVSDALFISLLAVAGVGVMAAWFERRDLSRFKQGLLRAREGLLEPLPCTLTWRSQSAAVIAEYNATMEALSLMFRTVEECQGRFLNQRNSMNAILQSVPGALLSLSSDLQITMANKQAEELFATPQNDLMGSNLFDLLHLGEHDHEMLRDAFLYKQPIRNQEISLTNDPERFYALNLGFNNDQDDDLGGVIILQDISEYRRLQDSVALREKLVAMGQLAAGVAHELNTPLGNISGYAQLLGQSSAPADQRAMYLDTICQEANRCSRIVQDLLNFARTDRCNGETCDINQLVEDLVETFLNCRLRRYKIDVRLSLSEIALVAEGGCGQLDIVLTNVITNAIHALDGVTNPEIVVASWQEGSHVVIGIADNGPGVPKELRSRIFDPFFTTKEVGEGSGLGLPICHAILAKRGGYIEYDDAHAGGARFLIRLPAVDVRRAGLVDHSAAP